MAPADTSNLAIWWMTRFDAMVITTMDVACNLPEYIKEEIDTSKKTIGFGARKLRVPRTLSDVQLPQNLGSGIYRILTQSNVSVGGIVFLKTDLPTLPEKIGLVTDFEYNILPQGGPPSQG
ncbi:MAG: hypothetical protein WC776_02475 [Patescibacteria group bacterium]